MKIYRVKNGVIIQHATGAYSLETDWDELINREDLARYLRDVLDTSGLPLVDGEFRRWDSAADCQPGGLGGGRHLLPKPHSAHRGVADGRRRGLL